jgi:hypothetical protein
MSNGRTVVVTQPLPFFFDGNLTHISPQIGNTLPADPLPRMINPSKLRWEETYPNPEYPATIHEIRELEIFIDKRMRDFQITSLDDVRIQDSLPSEDGAAPRTPSFNTSIC